MNVKIPAPGALEANQAKLDHHRLSRISSVATAVPRYQIGQQVAQHFCRALFHETYPDIDRFLPVFGNALVENRYFSVPEEWFETDHSFAEKNRHYIETAVELGEKVILSCLRKADLAPQDIDHIFFVSTTGLATPGSLSEY